MEAEPKKGKCGEKHRAADPPPAAPTPVPPPALSVEASDPAPASQRFLHEGLASIQFEEEWRFSEYRRMFDGDAWGGTPPEGAWSSELPAIYLDTSALLKLYKPEAGSSVAKRIEHEYGEHFGSSALALPEIVNGIWDPRKRGPGGAAIVFEDRLAMYRQFLSHLSKRRLVLLPMNEEVLLHVPAVARAHPGLRGQDLIHLTTLLCLRARRTLRGLGEPRFACSDKGLGDRAAAEGFDPYRLESVEDRIVGEVLDEMMKAVDSGEVPLKPGLGREKAKELMARLVRTRIEKGD